MTEGKTPYSDEFQEELQALLQKRRDETLKDLEFLRKNTIESSETDNYSEHTSYASHPADQGTDAQEREKNFMFADRESKYLQQVDDALKRMAQGKFGICLACGNPISLERLRVVPTAKLCITCKDKYSRKAQPQ